MMAVKGKGKGNSHKVAPESSMPPTSNDNNPSKIVTKDEAERKYDEMRSVFPLKSPKLFEKLLDVILLLNNFYLSMLLVSYIRLALEYKGGIIAVLLMVMPSCAVVFIFSPILIKKYSLLHSVIILQPNILGKVVERTEELFSLQKEIADKVRNQLNSNNMERSQLRNVFKVIGTNEDYVNAEELRDGLQNLKIHLSDQKFDRLVSLIDTNDNGRIEFIEFEELIFGTTQAEHVNDEGKVHGAMGVIMKTAGRAADVLESSFKQIAALPLKTSPRLPLQPPSFRGGQQVASRIPKIKDSKE